MSEATRAYTSTVVAPGHLAAAVVLGAGVAAIVADVGPVWIAVGVALVVILAGVQLSVVRAAFGPERIVTGHGWWGRGQVIGAREVVSAVAADLTWPQVFGIGLTTARRTARYTVRPGPTVSLRLRDGELVRISVDDPGTALGVLARPAPGGDPT